jgi:putative drug exporter of the RND superfamily
MTLVARMIYRRPWLVLATSLLVVVLGALFGSTVFSKLKAGGFDDPQSESMVAKAVLSDKFGIDDASLVFLVTARDPQGIDSPDATVEGRQLTADLAREGGVHVLAGYWTPGPQQQKLRSHDGRQALVVVGVDGDADTRLAHTRELANGYRGGIHTTVRTGGFEQVNADLIAQSTNDLIKSELVAVPIIVVLLILAFGSVLSAALPLIVAGVAIVGTFASLAIFAVFTDVSVYAINLTTALGLGLGIDYSLLLVSRYREERSGGKDQEPALVSTLQSAGRTVLYSAIAVAMGLGALAVFPLYFLRSFAYSGIAVVAVAAAAAIIILPALLVILGSRLERSSIRRVKNSDSKPASAGFWYRLARASMRRPTLAALPVLIILLIVGAHFLSASYSYPSDRVLPTTTQGRQVNDEIREHFPADVTSPTEVVLTGSGLASAQIGDYAQRLSHIPEVTGVQSAAGIFVQGNLVGPGDPSRCADSACHLTISNGADPYGAAGEDLVHRVRAMSAPAHPLVSGDAARNVDIKDSISDGIPLAALIVGLSAFVLLFLFTGSVVIPLKAILLNIVVLAAIMGVLVWVFQDGNGAALLGFTPTSVAVTMPPLMFCVVFALSMDYEVFLLARIKELRDRGEEPETAVAMGLGNSGRIISTAAAILSVSLFALLAADISFIKWLGLGAGLAIVIDATVIRGVVVPAILRWMGELSWWAPTWMRKLHDRFGLAEATIDQRPAEQTSTAHAEQSVQP